MPLTSVNTVRVLALITIWSTLALLALGNVVTTTESGMGCGDHWPSCNGELIPDLSNMNVLIEFGHRVLAAIIGVFALWTTIAAWRVKDAQYRMPLRVSSIVALVLLTIQIILGAITVRYELPPNVVFMHLGVSMAFFAALIVLAQYAEEAQHHRTNASAGVSAAAIRRFHTLTLWTTVALYVQILLGAYVRHSGAGLACPDVPLCQGQLIPPLYETTMVHLTHRIVAIVVAVLVMMVAAQARRSQLPQSQLSKARWAAVLVVFQIILGVMSVLSLLSPFWTTLHLVIAAFLLALLLSLVVQSRTSTIEKISVSAQEVATT